MHRLFMPPADHVCMMDLAIVGIVMGSEVADSGHIATIVLIEGWLVRWTRRRFSIIAVLD